jgi:predicted transcriptional regulator
MTPDQCRAERENLQASTGALAAAAGLAERTIKLFEAGQVEPRPGTLIALRRGFRHLRALQAV